MIRCVLVVPCVFTGLSKGLGIGRLRFELNDRLGFKCLSLALPSLPVGDVVTNQPGSLPLSSLGLLILVDESSTTPAPSKQSGCLQG